MIKRVNNSEWGKITIKEAVEIASVFGNRNMWELFEDIYEKRAQYDVRREDDKGWSVVEFKHRYPEIEKILNPVHGGDYGIEEYDFIDNMIFYKIIMMDGIWVEVLVELFNAIGNEYTSVKCENGKIVIEFQYSKSS